jgi:hypothetical protein
MNKGESIRNTYTVAAKIPLIVFHLQVSNWQGITLIRWMVASLLCLDGSTTMGGLLLWGLLSVEEGGATKQRTSRPSAFIYGGAGATQHARFPVRSWLQDGDWIKRAPFRVRFGRESKPRSIPFLARLHKEVSCSRETILPNKTQKDISLDGGKGAARSGCWRPPQGCFRRAGGGGGIVSACPKALRGPGQFGLLFQWARY